MRFAPGGNFAEGPGVGGKLFVVPGGVGFKSMLKEFVPESKLFRTIRPAMLTGFTTTTVTNLDVCPGENVSVVFATDT